MNEELIKEGRNTEAEIDEAVRHIRALEAQVKELQEAILILQQKVT